jgi:sulfur transfer complex TusBCD TusB component (DsrH family)
MTRTLVLLTRPLADAPKAKRTAALATATEVALLENGVYTTEAERAALAPDGPAAAHWRALDVDVAARRIASSFDTLSCEQVVEAIERNETIITL